jgi:hypothetical protein
MQPPGGAPSLWWGRVAKPGWTPDDCTHANLALRIARRSDAGHIPVDCADLPPRLIQPPRLISAEK